MMNPPITQSEIEESLLIAIKLLSPQCSFVNSASDLKELKISYWNVFTKELDDYLDVEEKGIYSFSRCTGEAFYELVQKGITPKRKSATILALVILLKARQLTSKDLAIFLKNSKMEKGLSDITNRYFLLLKLKTFLDDSKEIKKSPLKDNIEAVQEKKDYKDVKKGTVYRDIFRNRNFQYTILMLILGVLFFIIPKYFFAISNTKPNPKNNLEKTFRVISYSNNKQAPCKIIVEYDLKSLKFDSAFFDFGDNRLHRLSKSKGRISHTITHSQGRFITLHIDTLKAKKHITINSKGWLTMVENLYLPEEWVLKNGVRYLPQDRIPSQILKTGVYLTAHQNIQDFGVDGDNMTFETRVKNAFIEGGIHCFDISIDLNGRINDSLRILNFNLLGDKCDEWARLTAGDVHLGGDATILKNSKFDLSEWKEIKVRTQNSIMTVLVENKVIYSVPYNQKIGDIVFLQILFKGTGSIDYVKLFDNKTAKSYIENF